MTTDSARTGTRLFPSSIPKGPISVPLSILDATVARFSNTGAIWLFGPAESDATATTTNVNLLLGRLKASFISTLNAFPQWAGQLLWSPVRPGGGHVHRFGRPMVVYGCESDPGVEWTTVYYQQSIEALCPPHQRSVMKDGGTWVPMEFPQSLLLSKSPLALHNLRDYKGLPCMAVQINLFADGGYTIGVKIAHPLADAQSLMTFMHLWAAECRRRYDNISPSSYGQASTVVASPVFDPQLLDSHAAGDIDGPAPDPALTSMARDLPLHRFDWWETSATAYPSFALSVTAASRPEPYEEPADSRSPGTIPSWETWDFSRPVSHAHIHFTDAELSRLRELARSEFASNGQGRAPDISRLDALSSHLWKLINTARGLAETNEEVYLNVTLGARTRVAPALPEAFIGSPIFLAHVVSTGSAVSAATIGMLAANLRTTMLQFTPDKVSAMLHDAAHEVSPQRLWQAFLGRRHTLVTSWMRLGVYKVDFEGVGRKLRYVQPVMPELDGCVQVLDSAEGGIDVNLYLEESAMSKLVEDQSLLAGF